MESPSDRRPPTASLRRCRNLRLKNQENGRSAPSLFSSTWTATVGDSINKRAHTPAHGGRSRTPSVAVHRAEPARVGWPVDGPGVDSRLSHVVNAPASRDLFLNRSGHVCLYQPGVVGARSRSDIRFRSLG